MIALRNFAYYATIPINIALIFWVWIGRALVGSGGWWVLLFLIYVVPVLIIALGLTTVLAILQHRPASSGLLSGAQFISLVVLWLSMFGFGLFIVDFGDSKDSYSSAFSQIFGAGTLDVSDAISRVFAYSTVLAWVTLLVFMIIGMQGRAERKAFELQQGSEYDVVGWPSQP